MEFNTVEQCPVCFRDFLGGDHKIVLFDRAPDGRVEICGFSSKPFIVKCQKTYVDIQLLYLRSCSTSGRSGMLWAFYTVLLRNIH